MNETIFYISAYLLGISLSANLILWTQYRIKCQELSNIRDLWKESKYGQKVHPMYRDED